MPSAKDVVYSATYSNVPVYEFNVAGNHIMRRRSDDWINATHILKVADYDKPARTRILEREVQKGVHEKVQGGYGKYQGTWIPLPDGRELAAKNGVLDKLRPIFDYVAGDRSPPPAPKHATAASSKPRAPRAPAQSRRQPGKNTITTTTTATTATTTATVSPVKPATKRSAVYAGMPDYEQMDVSMHEGDGADDVTVISDVYDDFDHHSQYTGASRKRRRVEDTMTQADKEHQLWAEELLDYFLLQDNPQDSLPEPPLPPQGADLDRAIDDKGHTALHWAAAMGDIEIVKDLIRRGAAVDVPSKEGETPLMRAVLYTNSYDRQNMEKLAGLLMRTVGMQNWYGNTVFHHIANSTHRKSKYQCARYYIDSILNKMTEVMGPGDIERVLNMQDQHGDTAITIAARNGARRCVRSLLGRNAAVDVPNNQGQTADSLIVQLNHRRHERSMNNRAQSSSPFQSDPQHHLYSSGAVIPFAHSGSMLDPSLSLNGFAQDGLSSRVYESESALSLTSTIVPGLLNKAKSLAMQLDAEVAEKENERDEAVRVLEERTAQIELLQRQKQELMAKEAAQLADGSDHGDELRAELEDKMREVEGLIQEEEDAELREKIEREEAAQKDSSPDDLLPEDEEEQVSQKLAIVRELQDLVEQRRKLFKVLVANLSNAGVSDKQPQYKRLITSALSVREEDVEKDLPEIVRELEDAQLGSVGVA